MGRLWRRGKVLNADSETIIQKMRLLSVMAVKKNVRKTIGDESGAYRVLGVGVPVGAPSRKKREKGPPKHPPVIRCNVKETREIISTLNRGPPATECTWHGSNFALICECSHTDWPFRYERFTQELPLHHYSLVPSGPSSIEQDQRVELPAQASS